MPIYNAIYKYKICPLDNHIRMPPLSEYYTESKLEKHTKTKCLVQSEAGFQASLIENLSMFNMSTHHCSIIYVIENKEKHNRSTLIVVSTCLCITLIWQLTIRAHSELWRIMWR